MHHWQLSEHSFLINFAEFSETGSFYSYRWNEGKDWPKFNFIRFKDEAHVDIDELNKFIETKIASNESVNLKFGVNTHFPEKLAYKATMAGTPISFVSTDASDFLNYKHSSTSVHKVKSIDQLKAWWIVNSGGKKEKTLSKDLFGRRLKRSDLRQINTIS